MENIKVKKLITTKCELLVSPISPIEYDSNFVYLEFVVGEGVDCYDNAEISSIPELYRFSLDDDGLFMYYRFKIYKKSFLKEHISGKFYYDDESETPRLMLGEIEITTSKALEEIANNCYETDYSIMEVVEDPVFSICRLNHCLSEFQRKFIFNGCGESKRCGQSKNDEFAREFLFSTVFILRQLIRQCRFEEALNILNSVNNCHGLCPNTKSSKTKKCNCCR